MAGVVNGVESTVSNTLYFQAPNGGNSSRSSFPTPGVPSVVPGVIEAENFDTGGEGVAYHDTSLISPGNSNYRVEPE